MLGSVGVECPALLGRSPLVGDGVFRDPEVPLPEHSPDVEAGGFAGVMTAQGLQIGSPADALAGLGIVALSS